MTGLYPWLKALHIVFVVTWFAGLFYLPRLFVYHVQATDTLSRERFELMERKLYRVIMGPSRLLTLVFGVGVLWLGWAAFASSWWLWLKLLLVVALFGYHDYCGRLIKDFAAGRNRRSERFFRIFNELPAVALIVIVILVVVKPF